MHATIKLQRQEEADAWSCVHIKHQEARLVDLSVNKRENEEAWALLRGGLAVAHAVRAAVSPRQRSGLVEASPYIAIWAHHSEQWGTARRGAVGRLAWLTWHVAQRGLTIISLNSIGRWRMATIGLLESRIEYTLDLVELSKRNQLGKKEEESSRLGLEARGIDVKGERQDAGINILNGSLARLSQASNKERLRRWHCNSIRHVTGFVQRQAHEEALAYLLEAELQAMRVNSTQTAWRLSLRMMNRSLARISGPYPTIWIAMAVATWRDRSDRAIQRERLLLGLESRRPGDDRRRQGPHLGSKKPAVAAKAPGRSCREASHPAEATWERYMRRA